MMALIICIDEKRDFSEIDESHSILATFVEDAINYYFAT